MTREILLVNFDFPPIQGPAIWRMLGFARHLPSLGWKVSVVCSDRNTWHTRMEPGLLRGLPPGIEVFRIAGRPAGDLARRVLPERAVQAWRDVVPNVLLVPAMKLALSALRRSPSHPFVVVTSGPPHIAHLVGLLLKSARPCLWIADFRDLWMDDPVQAWSGPYQGRLGVRAEQAVLRRADAVVTVSPTWATHLGTKRAAPVTLIRNATDTGPGALPIPERPWSGEERVLLFAGTPQVNNTAEELWLGIRKYLDSRPDGAPPVRFVFLGLGTDLLGRIASHGLTEHIQDLGAQPHQRTVALLRGADGALIPIRATGDLVSRGTIPAKLYQAVALMKPIVLLADVDGDAASLLAGYSQLFFAPGNDPDAIAAALHRFAAAPSDSRRDAAPPPELDGWTRLTASIALDRLISRLRPAFSQSEAKGIIS